MPRMKRPCDFCGKDMAGKRKAHVMVDGNDKTVCSEECITKYSKQHPKQHIVLIEWIGCHIC